MTTTKKITKKGTYKININGKSKDMIYKISKAKLAKGVHFNLVVPSGFQAYFEKSGNNLMIYSFSEAGKMVTTKITNYYKYYKTNSDILKYNGTTIVTPAMINSLKADFNFSGGYYNNNTIKEVVVGKKGKNYYDMQTNKPDDLILEMGGNDTYNVDPYNSGSHLSIYDYAGKDKYLFRYDARADVFDFKGNDNYSFYKNYAVNVTDSAGNDKYRIYYSGDVINILDKAGNDVYNIGCNNDDVKITDNKGNDKYNLTYTWDPVSIVDKAGNDKYYAEYAYYDWDIVDYKGNDSYTILSTDDPVTITDKAGNDKYKITGFDDDLTITDSKGKDIYNIKNGADYGCIKDYAGADTYNISNQNDEIDIYDGKEGSKAGGNDKYNLSYIYDYIGVKDYYGKENYNLNNVDYAEIYDYRLNDVYTLNYSYAYIDDYGVAEKVGKKMNYTLANDKYNIIHSFADIYDAAGNDIYKFSYTYRPDYTSIVEDKKGKDTYVVKNTKLDVIDYAGNDTYNFASSTVEVTDKGGTDTYKITSSNAKIVDDSASKKDSYTVNSLAKKVTISDGGGTGDILTISGAKKGNLIYMVDYDNEANAESALVNSGKLIIFDKTQGGFAVIENFFKKNGDFIETGADGKALKSAGCIETIKAGKTNVSSSITATITAANLGSWAQEVGAWLSSEEHAYGSINSLLQSGNDADIKSFITFCTSNGIK